MFRYQTSVSGKKNKKVVFFLAGWTMKQWHMLLFARILALNGYYCITYTYDNAIFSPDVEKTRSNIPLVVNDIKQQIEQLKKEGFDTFTLFGSSLGCMLSLMVADSLPEVEKIILNLTGADLAEAVWTWDRAKPQFKAELRERKVTLPHLKERWKILFPIQNADHLENKKILSMPQRKTNSFRMYWH